MKSRASFYNIGIGKNLLKRYWPMWTAYFFLLIYCLPMALAGLSYGQMNELQINYIVLSSAAELAMCSVIISVIAAMAMFGYLYSSRSCCMICTMPIKRETMFFTACLTGLVPMLLADAAVFGITALIYLEGGLVKLSYLLQWLATVAMANTAFYGMAVFCAMLTGNIIALPAVYLVLNLTAVVVEEAVKSLLGVMLYGFWDTKLGLQFLSPAAQIIRDFSVRGIFEPVSALSQTCTGYCLDSMKWLEIYCAVGLLLMLAALPLYMRRRMETAGDTVAVGVLKPVFKYCMCFGTAIVFAMVVNDAGASGRIIGGGGTLLVALLLMAGAVIGCLAAEMIMQRSLHVFRSTLKDCIIGALIMGAVAAACGFDILGYEDRIPDADRVTSVEIDYLNDELSDRAVIDDVIALHRQLIENKAHYQARAASSYSLWRFTITYKMDDGSSMRRTYKIDFSDGMLDDSNSDAFKLYCIMNSNEARQSRTSFKAPVTKDNILYCMITGEGYSGRESVSERVELSSEEAYELYTKCILPDAEDGNIGTWFAGVKSDYQDIKTNVTITAQVRCEGPYMDGDFIYLTVQSDSERCISWIKEHTNIQIKTLRELNDN